MTNNDCEPQNDIDRAQYSGDDDAIRVDGLRVAREDVSRHPAINNCARCEGALKQARLLEEQLQAEHPARERVEQIVADLEAVRDCIDEVNGGAE